MSDATCACQRMMAVGEMSAMVKVGVVLAAGCRRVGRMLSLVEGLDGFSKSVCRMIFRLTLLSCWTRSVRLNCWSPPW